MEQVIGTTQGENGLEPLDFANYEGPIPEYMHFDGCLAVHYASAHTPRSIYATSRFSFEEFKSGFDGFSEFAMLDTLDNRTILTRIDAIRDLRWYPKGVACDCPNFWQESFLGFIPSRRFWTKVENEGFDLLHPDFAEDEDAAMMLELISEANVNVLKASEGSSDSCNKSHVHKFDMGERMIRFYCRATEISWRLRDGRVHNFSSCHPRDMAELAEHLSLGCVGQFATLRSEVDDTEVLINVDEIDYIEFPSQLLSRGMKERYSLDALEEE